MINNTIKLLCLGVITLLLSCSDDDAPKEPLVVDFEISVNEESKPAEVTITNNTSGANSFNWSFQGGSPENSTEQNPSSISYVEDGEYTISLEASNGTETERIAKTFTVSTGQILSYQNITLGGIDNQSTIGSVFSTTLGEIIKSGDITDANGSDIDIAFVGISGMRFFESPDAVTDWELTAIPNATTTAYINYLEDSEITFSVETFDNMQDDAALRELTITNDDNGFPQSDIPRIILFENAAGKKGALKITDITPGRTGSITFDLKMQK